MFIYLSIILSLNFYHLKWLVKFDLLEINRKQLNGEACIVPACVTTQIKLVCFNCLDHYFPALKEHSHVLGLK